MGKAGDGTAVVDYDMKVFGVQNLRIADMSVCPFNPNTHTQAVAYLIGQTAAEKIIAECSL
jgi:choline dehydrogenase-like flavoprotein